MNHSFNHFRTKVKSNAKPSRKPEKIWGHRFSQTAAPCRVEFQIVSDFPRYHWAVKISIADQGQILYADDVSKERSWIKHTNLFLDSLVWATKGCVVKIFLREWEPNTVWTHLLIALIKVRGGWTVAQHVSSVLSSGRGYHCAYGTNLTSINSELYFYLRCDACNTLNAAWCGIILGNSFSQIFSNWHMCTISSEFLRVTQYWQCNFIYSHTKWNRPNTGYLHSLGTLFQRSIYQSKYKILRINGVFLGQFD